MKCKNCGNELKENDVFCSVCGTKVEASDFTAASTTTTADSQPDNTFSPSGFNSNPIPQDSPKKKKGIGKIVAVVCGIAVIALGATGITLAATGRLSNFVNKKLSSPEEYFKDISEKNINNNLNAINENYTKYVDSIDTDSISGNCKIEVAVGSSLKPLMGLISPELSNLEKAAIEVNATVEKGSENMEMIASVNGKSIASLNATFDFENEKGYMQIPELSKDYIDMSDVIAEANEYNAYTSEYVESLSNLTASADNVETLTNILKTYTNIVYDNIDNVKESTETIEASGIEQKCTALSAELDGNYVYNVSCEMLETLTTDEDMEKFIKSIDEEIYDDFVDNVEEMLDEVKNSKEDFDNLDIDMDYTYYVDSKGEIVGEEITLETVEHKINITCLMPQKGSDFGYICSLESDGVELFSIDGEGSIEKNILNGKFSLSVDEEMIEYADGISSSEDLIIFELSDIDIKDTEKGNLNGSLKIYSDAITAVSGYELLVDISSDDKEAAIAMTITSGEEEWAKLTITSKTGKAVKPLNPSRDDKVYSADDDEQMQQYVDNMDIDGFAENLSKATGIDITGEDVKNFFVNEMFGMYDSSSDYQLPDNYPDGDSGYDFDDDFDWGDDDLDGDVDFDDLNFQNL